MLNETHAGQEPRTETDDSTPDKTTASHGLSFFQLEVLRAIAVHDDGKYGERAHGLGIKRQLETWYGHEVNHGRLYPNLDELVEAGLLAKTALDKRTNAYALTDAGRDVLAGRATELSDFIEEVGA